MDAIFTFITNSLETSKGNRLFSCEPLTQADVNLEQNLPLPGEEVRENKWLRTFFDLNNWFWQTTILSHKIQHVSLLLLHTSCLFWHLKYQNKIACMRHAILRVARRIAPVAFWKELKFANLGTKRTANLKKICPCVLILVFVHIRPFFVGTTENGTNLLLITTISVDWTSPQFPHIAIIKQVFSDALLYHIKWLVYALLIQCMLACFMRGLSNPIR